MKLRPRLPHRAPNFHPRLRGRLVLLFTGVIAVSLTLSVAASLFAYTSRVRSELDPRITQAKTILDDQVQETIDRADSYSYVYRSSPVFIDYLEGRSSRDQLLDQFSLLLTQNNLDIIQLVDREGRQVIDRELDPSGAGRSYAKVNYIAEALDGRKTRTVGVYLGKPAILVAFPVRNSSGQLDGALALGYYVDQRFLERLAATTGGPAALFVGEKLVYSTIRDETSAGGPLPESVKPRLASEAKAPADQFPARELQHQAEIKGHPYLSLFVPLRSSYDEWVGTIRASLSLSEVTAASNRAILLLALFNLFTLVVAYLVAYVTSRRITSPIQKMREAAARIGEGRVGEMVEVHTGDELEELGTSLNRMSIQLHQLVSSLESSNQRNARILESIADGVFALDTHGRIVWFNPAAERITGWRKEDVIGRTADEILRFRSGREPVAMATYLPVLGMGGEPKFFRDLVLTTSRGERHITLTAAPLAAGAAEEIGGIATFYDMTKQFELDAMRQDFSFLVAHELKTPIAAMKGYLYLLERSLTGINDKQRTYFDRVRAAARQLSGLVDNVLDTARIDQNTFAVSLEPHRLEPIVQATVEDVSFIAAPAQVQIVFRPPHEPLPELMLDANRIREVVANLLTNAIKYSKPGSHVEVDARLEGAQVVVQVTDHGAGMPADELPRLFDKYYRTDSSNRKVRGTGIGLFLVKHIVGQHGGEVGVESEPGEGSKFYFRLPIVGGPTRAAAPATSEQPHESSDSHPSPSPS